MNDGRRLRAVGTLVLSMVVFVLTVGAAALGAQQDDLFTDPGRLERLAPLKAASGR